MEPICFYFAIRPIVLKKKIEKFQKSGYFARRFLRNGSTYNVVLHILGILLKRRIQRHLTRRDKERNRRLSKQILMADPISYAFETYKTSSRKISVNSHRIPTC